MNKNHLLFQVYECSQFLIFPQKQSLKIRGNLPLLMMEKIIIIKMGNSNSQKKEKVHKFHQSQDIDGHKMLGLNHHQLNLLIHRGNNLFSPCRRPDSTLFSGLHSQENSTPVHIYPLRATQNDQENILIVLHPQHKLLTTHYDFMIPEPNKRQSHCLNDSQNCQCSLGQFRPSSNQDNLFGHNHFLKQKQRKRAFEALKETYVLEKIKMGNMCKINGIIFNKSHFEEQQRKLDRSSILGLILKHPHECLEQQLKKRMALVEKFEESELLTIMIQCLSQLQIYETLGQSVFSKIQISTRNILIGKDGNIYISDIPIILHQFYSSLPQTGQQSPSFFRVLNQLGKVIQQIVQITRKNSRYQQQKNRKKTVQLLAHLAYLFVNVNFSNNRVDNEFDRQFMEVVSVGRISVLLKFIIKIFKSVKENPSPELQIFQNDQSVSKDSQKDAQPFSFTPKMQKNFDQLNNLYCEWKKYGTGKQCNKPGLQIQDFSSIRSKNLSSISSAEILPQLSKMKKSQETRQPLSSINISNNHHDQRNNQLLTEKQQHIQMRDKTFNELDKHDQQNEIIKGSSKKKSNSSKFLKQKNVRQDHQRMQIRISQPQERNSHKRTLSEKNREFLQALIQKEHHNMILEVPESEYELESARSGSFYPGQQERILEELMFGKPRQQERILEELMFGKK